MNKTTIIIIGLVLIAGSFYAGTKYNQGVVPPVTTRNFNRNNNSSGNGFVAGDIIAKDAKSITLKLRAGGSKIVFLTTAAPIIKSVVGTVSDLTIGEQVSVTGTVNPDGSVSAQSVQIRPAIINNSNN